MADYLVVVVVVAAADFTRKWITETLSHKFIPQLQSEPSAAQQRFPGTTGVARKSASRLTFTCSKS